MSRRVFIGVIEYGTGARRRRRRRDGPIKVVAADDVLPIARNSKIAIALLGGTRGLVRSVAAIVGEVAPLRLRYAVAVEALELVGATRLNRTRTVLASDVVNCNRRRDGGAP